MGKSICTDCAKRNRCDMAELGEHPFAISTCYCYEKGNPSNADRIRAMTDEELAHLLHSAEEHLFTGNLWSYEQWAEWLKQEADNDP